ncbi:aminoglycoside phosphotransferase family protein [Paenibacillus terreus]|uniref:Aminoglycoside phosphotransferase family protein n=1 Tax=Paenibacillus terreus TaxID=1387834 RepID=A0ABV5BBB4_9BACL
MSNLNLSEQLRRRIPALQSSSRLEKIHKGYSSDDKYVVYDGSGCPRYILRTFGIERENNKHLEFRSLTWMEEQGVRCSRPVEIGALPDHGIGYMIVSFVEGNDASEELPLLAPEQQFHIGMEAGLELRKIHQIRCPDKLAPWHERMAAKHHRYRTEYNKCGISIRDEERLLSFIDENLHIMQDRPNLFQHDDFHVGNLLVKDGKFSGVIDFNRYDWGDPVHEFVKVGMFSAEASVPFSVGQLYGYHEGREPDRQFWRLYSLYLAMTLISSVVWILKVKPEELELMMAKIHKVMEDHEGFGLLVPKWYSQYQHQS